MVETKAPPQQLPTSIWFAPTSRFRQQLNLTRELAFTQFKLKYTGSILGYLWSLLKPVMYFGIMFVVFTKLLKINANTPHFTLQLLVAIVVWMFFAETVSIAVSVIAANGGLLRKAYFPRPILVIAGSLSAFMTFAINMALIIAIAAPLGQIELGPQSLALVPLILELSALILGLSLMLSAFFVFYRDIGHIWEVGSQLLFYGSAVVYPLDPAFLGGKARILAVNPVAQIVEDIRHAIVTPHAPWTAAILGPGLALLPFALVISCAIVGYAIFRHLSPRFAESL